MRSGRGHTVCAAKPQLTVGVWEWKPVLVIPTTLHNGVRGKRVMPLGVHVCGPKCPNEALNFLLPEDSCPGMTFRPVGTISRKADSRNSVQGSCHCAQSSLFPGEWLMCQAWEGSTRSVLSTCSHLTMSLWELVTGLL